MLSKIARHLRIFIAIAKYSFIASLEYRFRTIVRIIRVIFEGLFLFVLVNSLFRFVPQIGIWNKSTLILTYAVFQTISGIAYFLISSNFERLGRSINKGELDFILTKPVDSHFFVAFQRMHAQNIFRIILAISLFIYAVNSLSLSLNFATFAVYLLLSVSGLVIFISLISIIATFSFWTYSDELVTLTNTVLGTTRYPLDIFPSQIVKLFTLIPLIFIVTVPTKALLGYFDTMTFITPIIAILTFILSRKFFYFGLKSYSSASS